MWPIFNESFAKKKRFVGPVNSAQNPLGKKKKKKQTQFFSTIQTDTNNYIWHYQQNLPENQDSHLKTHIYNNEITKSFAP